MTILLKKKYIVVQYQGPLHHNTDNNLVFETDDPIGALRHLEAVHLISQLGISYTLLIKDEDRHSL